jgi:Uma2 family endonuclease
MQTAFPTQALSYEEFLAHWGNDDRYELIDGEVIDLEPTGPHEQVSAFILRKFMIWMQLVLFISPRVNIENQT